MPSSADSRWSQRALIDEIDESTVLPGISSMPSPARSHTPRMPAGSGAARQSTARATRVEVPLGLLAEDARHALAAFASGAAAVQRTGRGLILSIEPTSSRSPSRFRIVRLPQRASAPPQDSAETAELAPDAAALPCSAPMPVAPRPRPSCWRDRTCSPPIPSRSGMACRGRRPGRGVTNRRARAHRSRRVADLQPPLRSSRRARLGLAGADRAPRCARGQPGAHRDGMPSVLTRNVARGFALAYLW